MSARSDGLRKKLKLRLRVGHPDLPERNILRIYYIFIAVLVAHATIAVARFV